MSLARAVTKRMKRADSTRPPKLPKEPMSSMSVRTHTIKSPTFDRSRISAPVALVSATNMLSYNAPSLTSPKREMSPLPTLTTSAAEDSDNSISGRSRAWSHSSRHTTSTGASSVDGSPISPAPNHLSGFFAPNRQLEKSDSTTSLSRVREVKEEATEPVPAIPQRALSHSKFAHQKLARQRSIANMKTTCSTRSPGSSESRTSIDMLKNAIQEEPHPFGKELQQLNEVAEKFTGALRDAEAHAELSMMHSLKLARFCAADYQAEIQPLFNGRFGITQQAAMAWI